MMLITACLHSNLQEPVTTALGAFPCYDLNFSDAPGSANASNPEALLGQTHDIRLALMCHEPYAPKIAQVIRSIVYVTSGAECAVCVSEIEEYNGCKNKG